MDRADFAFVTSDGFSGGGYDAPLPPAAFDHEDVVAGTEQLFGAIAGLCGNAEYRRAIHSTNDRLRPIRMLPNFNIPELQAEFRDLTDAWNRGHVAPLRGLVRAYHRRRLDIIPKIVSLAYREPTAVGDREIY
ncbi:MAG: hypothetical protein NVV72_10630 [Asticcacaulis sp.]|nr:hypothetical protein [Asticcacaulis sp.]